MQIPSRWSWTHHTSPAARMWDEVRTTGLSRFHWPEAAEAGAQPWRFASELLWRAPFRLRVRRLEVVAGPATNYENSSIDARLHTDFDPYLPAHLQVLICCRPAAAGGESLFLDGWQLAAEIRDDDPQLHASLLREPRIIPFRPGAWFGATLSMRLDNLVLVHGAMPPSDPVGVRFLERVKRARASALPLGAGDVVVTNHHRLLHGRTAFSDPDRLLLRLLIWLQEPMAAEPQLAQDARHAHQQLAGQVRDRPEWIRHRLGVFGGEGLGAAAFRHDFSRLPVTPDAQSAAQYAELAGVVRGLTPASAAASLPEAAAALP